MKEYSDLELNKMIATLDFDAKDIEYPIYNKGYPYVRYFEGDVLHRFNAIINKEYLFDLMVKYKVEISYEFNTCGFSKASMSKFDTEFKSESEIPRAIIECILKSKNII